MQMKMKRKEKKAGVAVLVSAKVDFKTKAKETVAAVAECERRLATVGGQEEQGRVLGAQEAGSSHARWCTWWWHRKQPRQGEEAAAVAQELPMLPGAKRGPQMPPASRAGAHSRVQPMPHAIGTMSLKAGIWACCQLLRNSNSPATPAASSKTSVSSCGLCSTA